MILNKFLDLFIHLDKNLSWLTQNYGSLTYLFLFLIIFLETGLVITPFLPGDSLVFTAGAISSKVDSGLNVFFLFFLLSIAAIIGDNMNYFIGSLVGKKIFEKNYRLIKKEYLIRTQDFYEKHGGKTIIIARFVPIIRTFAPFVAGVGKMKYKKFLFYNIIGGIFWIGIFIFLGYFFGTIPFVRKNFSLIIIAIILISIIPAIYEYAKHRLRKGKRN